MGTDYYNSDEWQDVRKAVWSRAAGKCERCGAPGRDVHHLRYKGIFRHELEGDNLKYVHLLCKNCHDWQHRDKTGATHDPSRMPTFGELERMLRDFR